MYVVSVTVDVTPDHVQSFIEATLDNARHSRLEAGNVRFDVLEAKGDPSRFFLYEVYREKEDFRRHHETPHCLRWKETVEPWMALPRQPIRYLSLFPGEDGWT